MNIVFRTDASLEIGTGHVMRCLTLAAALRQQGSECRFICREHPGNLIARIRDGGFSVTVLPLEPTPNQDHQDAGSLPKHAGWLGADWHTDAEATRFDLGTSPPDWLVVDHYALDGNWERHLRPHCRRIMVIDDLADRSHDCDLLLDQTLGRDSMAYAELVPKGCVLRIGPRYALLRPEFALLRGESLERRESPVCRNLLVTMGGIDRLNATGRVLAALTQSGLPGDCNVVVVMGEHAPWLEDVRRKARMLPLHCKVKVDASDIARLMVECDLVVGAAGGSAWERCVLGVPSLVVVTAHNQEAVAKSLEQAGAVRLVGDVDSIERTLPSVLRGMGARQLAEMSQAAVSICDGRGVDRVVNTMRMRCVAVRRMREDDLETVLQWRNHPDIRSWMHSSHLITPEEHRAWYARTSKDPRRHLLIVEEAGTPLGFVQFSETGHDGVVDWGFYTIPGAPCGSGQKLGMAALDYAFTQLGVRKIRGEVIPSNQRSAAFHRKLGFADEGVAEARFSDGATEHPVLCFGLEANDWLGR